jgi:hypothetical protein
MGWRGTVVLALCVLLAALAFFLGDDPRAPLPSTTLLGEPRFVREETPSPRILDFDPADVARITLGFGDEVVSVERLGSGWRGAADARHLGDFLASLREATVISSLEGEGELADYGLDAPKRRILLEGDDGARVMLFIGERNPAGTAVYVRPGDGPVSMAGALVLWEFDKAFAAITGRKAPL